MPASLLALFLAGEVAFRLAWFGPAALRHPWDYTPGHFAERGIAVADPDPRILWRLAPSHSAMLKGARFSTNAAGFRGAEIALEKRPGEHRIAALGASITAGEGVADGVPYPAQLEARLHALGRDDVTVINAAVSGYEASQLVAAYDTQVRPYRPDAVLVPVYPGLLGHRDQPQYKTLEGHEPWDVNVRRLLEPSFLVRALRAEVQRLAPRLLSVDWAQRANARRDGDDRPTFATILAGFADALDADGTRLYLVLLPKAERYPKRRLAQLQAQTREFVASRPNVVVLDLLDEVAPAIGRRDRVFPGDRHPNERYHTLVASGLAAALGPHLPPP